MNNSQKKIARLRVSNWFNVDDSTEDPTLIFTVNHAMDTPIADVGLQLWSGSYVLVEYLLTNRASFTNKVVLELGAGCGFVGAVLSLLETKASFVTDYSYEILNLTCHNLELNNHLLAGNTIAVGSVGVRILDWYDCWEWSRRQAALSAPCDIADHGCNAKADNAANTAEDTCTSTASDCTNSRYAWTAGDVKLLHDSEVLFVAADVLYDDLLTEALFIALSRLMRPGERFVTSLEKRVNFSVAQQKVAVTGYDLFRRIIDCDSHSGVDVVDDGAGCVGRAVDLSFSSQIRRFSGRLVDPTREIRPYIRPTASCAYRRDSSAEGGSQWGPLPAGLELWEITCLE